MTTEIPAETLRAVATLAKALPPAALSAEIVAPAFEAIAAYIEVAGIEPHIIDAAMLNLAARRWAERDGCAAAAAALREAALIIEPTMGVA